MRHLCKLCRNGKKNKIVLAIHINAVPVLNTTYFWIYGREERREEGVVVVVLHKICKADLQVEELDHRSLWYTLKIFVNTGQVGLQFCHTEWIFKWIDKLEWIY